MRTLIVALVFSLAASPAIAEDAMCDGFFDLHQDAQTAAALGYLIGWKHAAQVTAFAADRASYDEKSKESIELAADVAESMVQLDDAELAVDSILSRAKTICIEGQETNWTTALFTAVRDRWKEWLAKEASK